MFYRKLTDDLTISVMLVADLFSLITVASETFARIND